MTDAARPRSRAVAVDRPLRAADRAGRARARPRLRAAAGTRASSPRAAHRVLAVDRDAAALAALAGVPGVETRVRRSRRRHLAARGRALRRDRRRQLPAPAAVRARCSPRWPATACCSTRRSRRATRRFGRPANPDFLLRPGELLALAAAPARASSPSSRAASTPPRRAAVVSASPPSAPRARGRRALPFAARRTEPPAGRRAGRMR